MTFWKAPNFVVQVELVRELARYLLEIYLFSVGSSLFKFAKGKFTGILKRKNESPCGYLKNPMVQKLGCL